MDWVPVAKELVRALRGKRSQTAFSRRLGYRTNVAYMWEAGRTFPTASVALRAMRRTGLDVRGALQRFYRVEPEWLARCDDPTTPAAVCALLEDLRAGRPLAHVASAVGSSRFAVARLLHGDAEPRLPSFLQLVDALSLRGLDFVAAFVDPAQLPSLAEPWQLLQTSRRAAYDVPWTHAVLRTLELAAYRALPAHVPGWIAERLDITRAEETQCLELLAQTGQIALVSGHWTPNHVLPVDTRHNPEDAARLRRFWAEEGLARASRDPDAVLSFNLGTVSAADVERVRDLHRRYFSELRDLIASSEPGEHVLLANVQLVRLT
jgi:DNA-binding phage protein